MIEIRTDYQKIIPLLLAKNQISDNTAIYQLLSEMQKSIIKKGDVAVKQYTKKFDGVIAKNFAINVTSKEIQNAYEQVPKQYIKAVLTAKKNIEDFHKHQLPKNWFKELKNEVRYGMQYNPLAVVGLYVPGGKAPYPSTVLMNAIPATLAGVKQQILTTPPQPDGTVAPQILVAADLCGITQIYKVGGAQAIFALAYGTKTIPKVDKIVGPGNIYVTLAKQLVYGMVDIDKPAGPSEALVYIQDHKYVAYAAAELLSQLEHDPKAMAIAISEKRNILEAIQIELKKQFNNCRRQSIIKKAMHNSVLFLTNNVTASIEAINACASEHVVLLVDNFEKIYKKIKHAGALFLGPYTPVALGDYFAGPNHVLPTAGAARFASPLGVLDFMKYTDLLFYPKDQLFKAQNHLKVLTEMEGFDAHYNAVAKRLDLA
jgi:histidinol dehydrogenase